MDNLIVSYISCAHLFEFILAYIFLDRDGLKLKVNYLFIFFILCFSFYVNLSFIMLDRLILFIFLFTLSFKNSNALYHSLLTLDVAFIIEVITSRMLFFIFKKANFIISMNAFKQIYFLLFIILLTTLVIWIMVYVFKQWIYPKLINYKLETITAYVLTFFILSYQLYEILFFYTDNMTFFRNFLVIFYVIFFIFFILIVHTFKKNERLYIETQQNQLEYSMMIKYANELQTQYKKIRQFRHDYINILTSMEGYLEQNNIEDLKKYYNDNIKTTKDLLKPTILHLDELQKIECIEIKSILVTKLIDAEDKKIDVQLEITDTIPKFIPVDSIVLIRIIGILFDNAIEELEALEGGQLRVAIFIKENNLTIIIQNSIRETIEPLHVLKQEGFSTKGKDRGMGLSNVHHLIQSEKGILLETSISDEYFIQKIIIPGEWGNHSAIYFYL